MNFLVHVSLGNIWLLVLFLLAKFKGRISCKALNFLIDFFVTNNCPFSFVMVMLFMMMALSKASGVFRCESLNFLVNFFVTNELLMVFIVRFAQFDGLGRSEKQRQDCNRCVLH